MKLIAAKYKEDRSGELKWEKWGYGRGGVGEEIEMRSTSKGLGNGIFQWSILVEIILKYQSMKSFLFLVKRLHCASKLYVIQVNYI